MDNQNNVPAPDPGVVNPDPAAPAPADPGVPAADPAPEAPADPGVPPAPAV